MHLNETLRKDKTNVWKAQICLLMPRRPPRPRSRQEERPLVHWTDSALAWWPHRLRSVRRAQGKQEAQSGNCSRLRFVASKTLVLNWIKVFFSRRKHALDKTPTKGNPMLLTLLLVACFIAMRGLMKINAAIDRKFYNDLEEYFENKKTQK